MTRTALLTGITGQDSSFLAELLLSKSYTVFGTRRRTSTPNLSRIEHLLTNPNMHLLWADLLDRESLFSAVNESQPDEIYHLACQSDVAVSFMMPEYTRATIKYGTHNLLEACAQLDKPYRIYMAQSSEQFGNSPPPQNESTLFRPVSPYAMAKVDAMRLAQHYRSNFGVWISCGICFNHESPRRGEEFVTRKITRALGRMACGLQETCSLGNLESKRDWGHARDYVEAMWICLQHDKPDDFVIATGETRTVWDFKRMACDFMEEMLPDIPNFHDRFITDPSLLRPAEVHCLQGDASKAREVLGWRPRTTFRELVREMVKADYELARTEALCKAGANLRWDTRP